MGCAIPAGSAHYIPRGASCYSVLQTSAGDERHEFGASERKREEFISRLKKYDDSCRNPDVLATCLRFADYDRNGVIEHIEIERMEKLFGVEK